MSRKILHSARRGAYAQSVDSRTIGYLDEMDQFLNVAESEEELANYEELEDGQWSEGEAEQSLRDKALRSMDRDVSPTSQRSTYDRYNYLRRSQQPVEPRETRLERSRSPIRRSRRLLGLAAVGTQVRLTNTRPRLLKEPLLDPTNTIETPQLPAEPIYVTDSPPRPVDPPALLVQNGQPGRSGQSTQARGLLEKTTLPSQGAGGKKLTDEEKNVISDEISLGLAGWMTKGISTADSKAIQEEFKVIFENGKFSLNPPAIDEWAARRLKEKSMQKTVEAAEKVWLTTQFKVMDIAPPLLHILNHVTSSPDITPENPLLVATEAALAQWARAFNHVTRRRRQNVLKCAAPRSEHLLDAEDSFNNEEGTKWLFGPAFLSAMLKEANQELTLNQIEAAQAGPSGLQSRGRGTGRQNNRGGRAKSERGFRRQRGERGPRYVSHTLLLNFSLLESPQRIGGRISCFASNWVLVSSDPWVLQVVSEGAWLDLESTPCQMACPTEVAMSLEMQALCDKEVMDLLEKQAISEVVDRSPGFVSSLFVIPKKSGGFRPIINLKPLNKFVRYEHFKMEGLETVKNLVRKGDWLVKLDLKDAYLTIPIAKTHQKYLRFVWKTRLYQFSCLAFGLCSAPRIFTKVLKAVAAFIRERGLRLVIYLDDILLMNEDKATLKSEVEWVVRLLEALGFLINWEKSVATPSQTLEYLGVIIDSSVLSFALPLTKVSHIQKQCSGALSKELVSLREISSILGSLAWSILSVPFAQAHYRSLQKFFIEKSKQCDHNLALKCNLSYQARQDLMWWFSCLKEANGKVFSPLDPDLTIHSDASLSRWGACSNGVATGGPWSSELGCHINLLELKAAYNALKSFANFLNGICIRIFLDNHTAVCYLNKCGGTKSRQLSALAIEIAEWCETRNIQIQAVYIPGKLNVVADHESRVSNDSSDWMLSRSVFKKIRDTWPIRTDFFANAWNAQTTDFVSWKPQPGALAVDAFSCNWKNMEVHDRHGMSNMAESTVVSPYFRAGVRYAENPTDRPPTPDVSIRRSTSARGDQPDASRLETIRIALSSQGFSSKTIEVLLAGNRASTLSAYESAWRNWTNWCAGQHQNPMSNDLTAILGFLTALYTEGKSYSTINIHRSMLSMTLDSIDNTATGQHPLVKRFMKGCYNINPPRPKYSSMWDVEVVFSFMRNAGSNLSLDLPSLTKKLATLLAVSTLLRVSEIASLDKQTLEFSSSGAKIALSRPRKAQTNGPLRWVSVAKYADNLICPVDCLRTYIYLTDVNRTEKNQQHLFISLIRPFGSVSGNTLARWIKEYLSEAGIDTTIFSAHSTRGAAASGAARSGISMDSILRAGDWSNETTFAKYYNRKITL
ncbi:reverse transcriptase [Daphnia sinensis]|uniref:Reverse transcriptase n=1 Tax=Daphnia sinensis TaxID=1820382 RepID=A0AAD5LW76_9CRUS|nr:reverse transcriptase [Daphnia sinensis]